MKAFLKAGILTEDGTLADTQTGTPQGGILSPVIANVALSVLDEHFVASRLNHEQRAKRRRRGLPNYRLIRYADLCRVRHKWAYADCRIMPTGSVNVLVSGG